MCSCKSDADFLSIRNDHRRRFMAKRRGDGEGLRARLTAAVEGQYGEVRTDTLSSLAKRAGVHYTVLAKFLLYETPQQRTHDIHERNLNRIALVLDTSTQWLRFGMKTLQRDMWLFALPKDEPTADADPGDEVRAMLREISKLPRAVQVRACREAVATMLGVVSASGAGVSQEGYSSLIRLDQLQRAAVA